MTDQEMEDLVYNIDDNQEETTKEYLELERLMRNLEDSEEEKNKKAFC